LPDWLWLEAPLRAGFDRLIIVLTPALRPSSRHRSADLAILGQMVPSLTPLGIR
jgi:hypothetical protein